MSPTTTPNDDERRQAKLEVSSRYGKPSGQVSKQVDPATGRDDTVRLAQTTDDLLYEILRRPGQLFVVSHGLRAMRGSATLEQWTYLEFADGDRVEVRYAR